MPDVFDELDDLDQKKPKRDVFDEVAEQDAPRIQGLEPIPPADPFNAPYQPGLSEVLGQPSPRFSESLASNAKGVARELVADPAVSLAKGVVGIPQFVTGLGDIVTGGGLGKGLEDLTGYSPKTSQEFLDQFFSESLQDERKKVQEAKGFLPTIKASLENPATVVNTALESLPSMLAGGAMAKGLGVLPKIAKYGNAGKVALASAGEGAITAGQQASTSRENSDSGLLTPEQAALALGSGVTTSVLGLLGGKVAQKLGVADIDSLVAGAATKTERQNLASRIVKEFISEGAFEELPQSATEQIYQNIADGKPWNEGVTEAAAQGFVTGGVMGAAGSGFHNGAEAAPEAAAPKQVVIPTADDLVKMAPNEILEWKRRTKYGPEDPAKIAAQIDPAELPRIEEARDEARAQAREMLSQISDPNDNAAIEAANLVSLKAQTLNEVAQELAGRQPAAALSMEAGPEVANLAPQSPGGKLNDKGDPAGTTYHATPEDWQKWQEISQSKDPFATWGEREKLKNKYGGMPPVAPKQKIGGYMSDLVPHAFLEVAPNPDDKVATAKWNALPPKKRAAESRRIADKILPRVLQAVGVKGKIVHDVGRFMGANNANIRVEFDPQTTFDQAKLATMEAGRIMRQQAVVVADESVTTGDNLVGFVKFLPAKGVSADQVEAIFDKIGMDGSRTPDGGFAFGNFSHFTDSPISDEQMLQNVLQALNNAGLEGEAFTSKFKSEYIDNLHESVNKAYGNQATSTETGGESVRQRPSGLDDLAAEFDQEFNQAVSPKDGTEADSLSLKKSIQDRTALDVLEGFPNPLRLKNNSPVFTVADFLSRRSAQHGILRENSPENSKVIATALAEEAEFAAKKNSKAVGWYGKQMKDAMRFLIQRHPDLDGNKGRQSLIRAMIAITSNGQDVFSNFKRADELYSLWKSTGKIDTTGNFGGKESAPINEGLFLLQRLVDVIGVDNLPTFLSGKYKVAELQKAGLQVPDESADYETYGSAVFGPKIGGGFYQNLSGNFDPVTIDRWFMRTFNRIRGTLTAPSLTALDSQIDRVLKAINKKDIPNLDEIKRDAARIKKQLADGTFDPFAEVDNPGPLLKYTNEVFANYRKNGFRPKTHENMASQRFADEMFGLNDAPLSPSERQFIRDTFDLTQQILKKKGINLNNADLQAVLWYLEKEIYGRLGATTKRAEPASYSDAAKSLALGEGQPDLFEERGRAGSVSAPESTPAAAESYGEAGQKLSPKKALKSLSNAFSGSLQMGEGSGQVVDRSSAREVVNRLQANFPAGLQTVVVEDYHGLPDSVHQMAYSQGGHPSLINAAVQNGKVYIVASQMDSLDRVVEAWLHEQAGHFATDEILGDNLKQFMGQVHESFSNTELMDQVRQAYPSANDIRLGREFVARLAENPQADPSTWNKLVAMVRQWLRGIGWVGTVTENDIRVLLSSAMAKLASKDTFVSGNATIFAPAGLKIDAFHGTPHKIRDRFKLERIGKGTGSRVYGWGLYFAENEETASQYKNITSAPEYYVDGVKVDTGDKPINELSYAVEKILLLGQEKAEDFVKRIIDKGGQSAGLYNRILQSMVSLRGKKLEQRAGNLYKVELGVDENELLDYDANSDDLDAKIYNSLKKFFQENIKSTGKENLENYFPAAIIGEFLQSRSVTSGMFYEQLSRTLGSDEKASKFLHSLGVKGIKFKDQRSRAMDEKSTARNFVVFDDGDITITHENGEKFTPAEAIENAQRTGGDGSLMMRPPPNHPELGLDKPAPEPERADTKGKFFTGEYTTTDRMQQNAAAEKFIEYKPNADVISQLTAFAGGQSVPGLSQQNYSATIAAVMKRMFAKIASSKNPADIAELWQLMDRAKSLAQQEGSVTAQSLEARKVFGEQLGFMAPVLAFRGLAQKAWARMLGLPEGTTAEDAVSGITKQATDEAGADAQEEVEINQSELAARRIISQLATSQSDTLKWPKRTIDGVRETVKWFINGDITDAEFRSTMAMLKIGAGVTDILHSVAVREREITDRWNQQKSDEAKAKRQNNEEMRLLRARAMIAYRLGMTAEQQVMSVINEFAKAQSDTPPADRPKQMNGVKEVVRGFLNDDITESEFKATLESIGISGHLLNVLLSTTKREYEVRRQWQMEKERQRAGAITASILEHDSKLRNILNQIARENGVNWSELFLDSSRATQAERRAHLEAQIRQHPNLQNLTPEQQAKLALMLDRTWEQARLGVMRKEFSKRIQLPNVGETEKVFDRVLPELIRQANLGSLDDAAFLNAFSKELGLPSLNGDVATRLTKLAQEAQAAPEGVRQNKILQKMVDEIQQAVPAHPFDIIRDFWYNNVLSGSRTLTAILTGSWIHGAVMAAQQAMDAALLKRRPAVGGRILQAFLIDTLEGIANGWDVLKTGDYTRRAEFSQNMNQLLSGKGRMDSLEGWLKHGNLWQKAIGLTSYARRAVIGMDYVGAIGTRGAGVIYNAMLNSPEQLQQALTRFDKDQTEQARKQAKLELGPNAKPVDVRKRTSEILEKNIDEQIRHNAAVLGEVAAINSVPVGFGGIAYRILESMPRAIQSATGASKESAAFAAFLGKAAAGLAFARAAINMTQSASNWMPLVGGVNWARALLGKKLPEGHWARVMGVLDAEGKPLTEDRRRLIAASQVMGISLVAIAYAMTRGGGGGDDEDKEKKRFDVSGSWYGITPQQRKDRMASGERPLSIRVNGRWINYGNLPMAGALATVGNLRDRERSEGKRASADDVTGHIVDAWASGIFYIKDVSVLSSLSRALGISAMNTDEGASALNRLVAQQASNLTGLIPFGSAVREIDTFFDPKTYSPTKGMDYWIRGIPFVRRATGEGPDYNMAGLPVENMLTPQSRLVAAQAQRDPVMEVMSRLIAQGKFPHHPDVSPSWVKNGEQKSAKDLPKETYRYQTEVLKKWREIMLTDIDFLKQASPESYEDYYRKYLAPVRDQIKADMQREIDPSAIDMKGRIYPEYRNKK